MARPVTPDGEKICGLCDQRRWGAPELAKASGLALATATDIRKGKPCFRKTLMMVANALEQQIYTDLIKGNHPPQKHEIRYKICLVFLDRKKEDFDEDQLITIADKLKQLIGGSGDIDMENIENGSVILTLSLNEKDMLRLLAILERDPDKFRRFQRELGIERYSMDIHTEMLLQENFRKKCPHCCCHDTRMIQHTWADVILPLFLFRHYICRRCATKFWRFR